MKDGKKYMILVPSRHLNSFALGKGRYFLYHSLSGNGAVVNKATISFIGRLRSGKQPGIYHAASALNKSLAKLKKYSFLVQKGIDEHAQFEREFPNEKKIIERGELIGVLRLEVASFCNFRCKYCYCSNMPEWKPNWKMSYATAKQSVDSFIRLMHKNSKRSGTINFFGGEPLLNWEVLRWTVEYAEKIAKKYRIKVAFGICTNASLFNEEIYTFVKRHSIKIRTSLDGFRRENDAVRVFPDNRGTFDLTVKAMDELSRRKIDFSVQSTLNDYNFYSIEKVIDFLHDRYGLKSMALSVIQWQKPGLKCNLYSNEKKAKRLTQIYKYAVKKGFKIGGNWRRLLTGSVKSCKGTGFCSGQSCMLYVRPTGSVYPCESIGTRLGHISNVKGILHSKQYFAIAQRLIGRIPGCRGCKIEGICAGECAGNIQAISGDVYDTTHPHVRALFCDFNKRLFKKLVKLQVSSEHA